MAENRANFKVLIGDDDSSAARRLSEFLGERGFATETIFNGKGLKEKILNWQPTYVVCDLTFPSFNAPQLLTWLRDPGFKDNRPKVFVTSAHNVISNIRECIGLGASDYIVKPYKCEDILTRLIFQIQSKRELLFDGTASSKLTGGDIYMHLLDIVLREALSGRDIADILYNLTKMISITLSAVRCSVISVAEDLQTGEVSASSDDRKVRGLKLDMNKYPEVIHVMNSSKAVIIEDLEYDPMLAQIKNLVKGISFNSMIVCPVKRNNEMYGVISARMAKEHSKFNDRDIRFVNLVAQIVSLVLSTNINMPHEFLDDNKIKAS